MLQKVILFSIILASFVIPARAAREPNVRVGFKKALVQMLIFQVIYLFLVAVVWMRVA